MQEADAKVAEAMKRHQGVLRDINPLNLQQVRGLLGTKS